MKITDINFESVESVTYHGQEVIATPEQITSVLGAPSIEYGPDVEGKQRTEWDRCIDGVAVKVFDHHHYGAVSATTKTVWSVEASDGTNQVSKGITGEFVSVQQTPTPTESKLASLITGKL